jgi:glycerol dehydrogenase
MYHKDHTFHEYLFTKRHPTLVLVDTAVVAQAPRRMLVGGLGGESTWIGLMRNDYLINTTNTSPLRSFVSIYWYTTIDFYCCRVDALATWFEARTIKEAHGLTFVGARQTETAAALAKLSYDIVIADGAAAVQAVDAKVVTPALERVVEANTLLSGLGFESGGLCVAHSVHNGLTSQSQCMEYTHGERVAFGLLTQLVLEGRPQEEIDIVLNFCSTVGLPITLKALSIDATDENAIQEVAARSLAPGETAHREPFEVTVDMMADAIRGADQMGTLYEKGLKCWKREAPMQTKLKEFDATK